MTILPSQSATHTQEFVRSTNASLTLTLKILEVIFQRSGNMAVNRKIDSDICEVDRPSQVILPNLDHSINLNFNQGQHGV